MSDTEKAALSEQLDKAWEAREQFFEEHGYPEQTDYHRGVSYIGFKAGFEAGRLAALEEAEKAVEELAEAIRLTVEYVGIEVLPPLEGWSWFDALRRHRPAMASHFAVPGDSCPEGGRQ